MAPILTTGAGSYGVVAGLPPTYAGPGDVATFLVWYGLRGYSGAYATGSNPAVDIVDQAGAHPLTVNILNTGALDVASIAAWVTANSVSTILVSRIYDQTGGGRHANAPSTAASPRLLLNTIGGTLPVIRFVRANSTKLSSASMGVSLTTPGSNHLFYNNLAASADDVFVGHGTVFSGSNPDEVSLFDGAMLTATCTDNVWHSVATVYTATASSQVYVDGSLGATGSAGAGGYLGNLTWGEAVISAFYDGQATQAGVYAGTLSSGNAAAISTQDHAYWGV